MDVKARVKMQKIGWTYTKFLFIWLTPFLLHSIIVLQWQKCNWFICLTIESNPNSFLQDRFLEIEQFIENYGLLQQKNNGLIFVKTRIIYEFSMFSRQLAQNDIDYQDE